MGGRGGWTGVTLDVSAVPPRPAGAGRYITELARELDRLVPGRLDVVCQRGDRDRWQRIAPDAGISAVLPRARAARLVGEQVLPLAARGARGRIWHGPHYTLPLAYRRGPRVVTVHDLSLLTHPQWHEPGKVRFFGQMIPRAVAAADHVLCVSEHTRRELLAHLPGTAAERVSVAPLGLDAARFTAAPGEAESDTAVRARFGLTGRYLLAVATAEPRKNLARLIQAFDLVAAAAPDVALAMVGQPGWKTGDVATALDASPYRNRVRSVGFVADADLPPLLRGAAALCYPSLYEGFGLPVLEAMACGTVAVTSAGSVMQEIAGDGARYVDPTDTASLAEGLRQVLDLDPGTRAELVARGRARAAGFTWTRTAELTLDGYDRAAAHWAERRARDRRR